MRIVVTGATGLVGSALVPFLRAAGHRVDRLVRRDPEAGSTDIRWDPAQGVLEKAALEGVEAVIHLAGENVGEGRWTEGRKRAILESRIKSTELLSTRLSELRREPSVFISASAVGYYGNRGKEVVDEGGRKGEGFLADVCDKWEGSALHVAQAGIRVVHPRIGVVLTRQGGALPKMAMPVRWGVGGPVGAGTQMVPWISMKDLLRILQRMVEEPGMRGVYNTCAPLPVSNEELTHLMGKVLRRPTLFRVPSFAIRSMFGQMGEEVLLGGADVRPTRLLAAGFRFEEADLEGLLRQELC